MLCSVHKKCNTVIIWRAFLGSEGLVQVFLLFVGQPGSNKKFVSGNLRYIFRFINDKKLIKVNVKPTFYCSLSIGNHTVSSSIWN